jgi:hypothetical protein
MSRSAIHQILINVLLLILSVGCATAAADEVIDTPGAADDVLYFAQDRESPAIQVTLSAPQTTTSWDERDPQRVKFDLPLLYLHRQREVAGPNERTLEIRIAGLAGGMALQVEAVSRHEHAYFGEPGTLTQRFLLPERPCTPEEPCTLQWEFEPETTFSDLYSVRVKNEAGELLWSNPIPDRPDFVLLDTWDVGVGAYTVRLYYAALFPYARDVNRLDYRLPPEAVPGFIESQMVPMIQDTWHTQLEAWGLGDPIHPDWDADGVVEVIITHPPFALFDGRGTYTVFTDAQGRPYPERRIWWLSTHPAFSRYDSWENAHRVIFAHEFFHMAQWNVLLSARQGLSGGQGLSAGQADTGQPIHYWRNTFIEAQAEFAVGVQYPDLELGKRHVLAGSSAYGNSANLFLTERLNASYQELEANPTSKYDLALYWRFLYEQYGDVAIVRVALEEMVRLHQPDLVEGMARVMNGTFARLGGPFHSFEESLIAFSHANYALRLENGRCATADLADCGSRYYDPDDHYVSPPLEAEWAYGGSGASYSDAVPASYGMDFIEVSLDPAARNRPLTITFKGDGVDGRFQVQVWRLVSGEFKPLALTPEPEIVPLNGDGAATYTIPPQDTAAWDRLALIITRLDSAEAADPVGSYTITLDSVR